MFAVTASLVLTRNCRLRNGRIGSIASKLSVPSFVLFGYSDHTEDNHERLQCMVNLTVNGPQPKSGYGRDCVKTPRAV